MMAKRFYDTVEVAAQENGFHITLDGHILQTPGKQPLLCPTRAHAKQIATEWEAQAQEIKPETMPCTRLMNVACEVTPARRPELVLEFRKYCESDLLCYRASHPTDLGERQSQLWQPVLEWVANSHQIGLKITTGLEAIPQPEKSLDIAANYADALDDTALTLLLHYTASFGSSILAMAVLEKYLSVDEAFRLSCLDEKFQNERWGADDEAVARNAAISSELTALSTLL